MPLPLLVDKLARAGGAGLERRQLAALTALARALPHRAAAGLATTNQLADTARYTGRWMREALAELEALAIVEWRRGGVVDGSPTPSWFRVDKRQLCQLIAQGVDQLAALLAQRAAETARRLAGLRYVRTRKARSRHVEVATYLTPHGEDTGRATAPVAWSTLVAETCEHGGDAAVMSSGLPRCPECRRQLSAQAERVTA